MTHTIVSNKFLDVCNNLSTWYCNTILGSTWKVVSVVTVESENTWLTTITYV